VARNPVSGTSDTGALVEGEGDPSRFFAPVMW
jgi:hypothetical protein